MTKVITKDIHQVVGFKASPRKIYEMLMDSAKHAAFTGAKAHISRKIGGRNDAYDGWIDSTNIKLVANKKIVQGWRGADWPEGCYSLVTFDLEPYKGGTRLNFAQIGVPKNKYNDIFHGWITEYWDKMKSYLEE